MISERLCGPFNRKIELYYPRQFRCCPRSKEILARLGSWFSHATSTAITKLSLLRSQKLSGHHKIARLYRNVHELLSHLHINSRRQVNASKNASPLDTWLPAPVWCYWRSVVWGREVAGNVRSPRLSRKHPATRNKLRAWPISSLTEPRNNRAYPRGNTVQHPLPYYWPKTSVAECSNRNKSLNSGKTNFTLNDTEQKTIIFLLTAVRTWNLTKSLDSVHILRLGWWKHKYPLYSFHTDVGDRPKRRHCGEIVL
jgi:hypothetical protein